MLNYIWAGFLISSLVFAMVYDVRDLRRDSYANGEPLALTTTFPDGYDPDQRTNRVQVSIDPSVYRAQYKTDEGPAGPYEGVVIRSADGREIRFAEDAPLPGRLETIREITSRRDNDLRGPLTTWTVSGDSLAQAAVKFPAVRFVKMQSIAQAALDFAETAVSLALGLIGVLALWMGLLKIAEASGLLYVVVRLTQPLLRPLFPEIPRDHPAFGMIVLNLTANMLGLGNAATPLGIKAMEELQTLNPDPDTATNPMVMLLAMNTASVQLVPPVLLVAIMGLQINQLMFAIIIVTTISLIVAVSAAKLLSRLPAYRSTDPNAQEDA